MKTAAVLCVLLLALLCSASAISVKAKLQNKQVQQQLRLLQTFFSKASKIHQQLGDISVECGICGIAVNEVEGFLAENITETEIEDYLRKDVCALLSGKFAGLCNDVVNELPYIIENIENTNSVSVICVDLGYCAAPFAPHADPVSIPQYTINLDLPPFQRWTSICSNSTYVANAQYLVNTATAILPGEGFYLADIGRELNLYYFPLEFSQEIQGCAKAMQIDFGWLTLLNLGYEVSDACTSIVAQTTDGKILHARNLDFWDGMGFTDTLKNLAVQVAFQKGGKTVFQATTFAGYVGVLSGMKPQAFSVTIDTRFYSQGLWEMFYEIIAAIEEKNASLTSFLTREVLMNENDFNAAVHNLADDLLIADVYYIVAGVSAGQGAVISRNRINATDIWMLDAPKGRWYEVQTNYDHWTQPPWFDDRVVPANNAMNSLGQHNLSLQKMLQVLSVKPVLNLQTTYSILACPADSILQSYTRYCPYPCVE